MRATSVKPAGHWSGEAADSVVLDYDERQRRRVALIGTKGLDFVLDLPEVVGLRAGDALVLEDGQLVEVVSAPEPMLELRCADPLHLARVAWHLGNRHLPTQIMPKAIRIRRDHVIADMARGLGAKVMEIEAPFEPEGGAYAGGHSHAAHAHGRAHSHSHGHDHAHDHHGHDHVHGPDCGHDHHDHHNDHHPGHHHGHDHSR